MPNATADPNKTEHFELETLPEGYVDLRKLTYGEMLRRRDIGSTMRAGGNSRKKGVEFDTDSLEIQHFEFSRCIVSHNLEDSNGRTLNMRDKNDIIKLDPRIAGEIESLISDMNQPPEDDEEEGSSKSPESGEVQASDLVPE